MDWQGIGNVLVCVGGFALLIGVLLRFKVGRWILGALLLILTLISLLSGDYADNPDTNDPMKASNYWLLCGVICLLLGLVFRALLSKSI